MKIAPCFSRQINLESPGVVVAVVVGLVVALEVGVDVWLVEPLVLCVDVIEVVCVTVADVVGVVVADVVRVVVCDVVAVDVAVLVIVVVIVVVVGLVVWLVVWLVVELVVWLVVWVVVVGVEVGLVVGDVFSHLVNVPSLKLSNASFKASTAFWHVASFSVLMYRNLYTEQRICTDNALAAAGPVTSLIMAPRRPAVVWQPLFSCCFAAVVRNAVLFTRWQDKASELDFGHCCRALVSTLAWFSQCSSSTYASWYRSPTFLQLARPNAAVV